MLQKFFENNLQTTFIKSILYNTALPIYRTVRDGDILIKGFNYIYKNKVIECTKTGKLILNGTTLENMVVGQYVSYDDDNDGNPDNEICSFKMVQYYTFGQDTINISRRHKCYNTYYDQQTHYFLGEYLRCMRDLYNVDLMGLYNCFNYNIIREIYLHEKDNDGKCYTLRVNDAYKEVLIPIKFNQVYSIAIDVPIDIMVLPVLYSDGSGLVRQSGSENLIQEKLDGFDLVTLKDLSFKSPKMYIFSTTDPEVYKYEKYLRLLIQIPYGCDSSLVVLEGDYSQGSTSFTQVDEQLIDYIDPHTFSDIMKIQNPSLLLMNDKNFYAYSDVLIQYLSHNAITSREILTDNIKRVQEQIKSIQLGVAKEENSDMYSRYKPSSDITRRTGMVDFDYGVWTNNLRYLIYKDFYYHADKYPKTDFLGFVDTNVEKYLNAVGGIK